MRRVIILLTILLVALSVVAATTSHFQQIESNRQMKFAKHADAMDRVQQIPDKPPATEGKQ